MSAGVDRKSLLQGAALWLRSSDESLARTAVELFAASRGVATIASIVVVLDRWPPKTAARVSELLTRERVRLGLTPWRVAVEDARAAIAARRAEADAQARLQEQRRRWTETDVAATRQVDVINEVRRQRSEESLSPSEELAVRAAVGRRLSSPHIYKNACWKCLTAVDSHSNAACPVCRWLACLCGSCRSPTYEIDWG
jgi:hypothetical protein